MAAASAPSAPAVMVNEPICIFWPPLTVSTASPPRAAPAKAPPAPP